MNLMLKKRSKLDKFLTYTDLMELFNTQNRPSMNVHEHMCITGISQFTTIHSIVWLFIFNTVIVGNSSTKYD